MASSKPPRKPPIWLHPSGQWCKKRKGVNYYFGSGTQEEALKRYLDEWPAIKAGLPRKRVPVDPSGLTVLQLINKFLHHKKAQVDAGEMSPAGWDNYRHMTIRVRDSLGRTRPVTSLGPEDFARVRADAAADLAPSSLATFIKLARVMFAFGGKLTRQTPDYGDHFGLPPERVLSLHRESRPRKLVAVEDLRKLIAQADPVTRAMILLGLNCGYGATDVSELRQSHLEARPGWLVMARRKTGTARRCPLWPETVAAIEQAWAARPRPADPVADADRIFLSPSGQPCRRFRPRVGGEAGTRGDWAGDSWEKLCRRAGVKAPGRFYVLKHVFVTEASNARDDVAVDQITGHKDRSMRATYRQRVDDARLQAVVDHVRAWVFGPPAAPGPRKKSKKLKS